LHQIPRQLAAGLFIRSILTCHSGDKDGYGSDSDIEEEDEKKSHGKLYGKKAIFTSGMRAIVAAFEASHHQLKSKKPKLCLHGAYYETDKARALLKIKFRKVQKISQAEILFYDANACVTDGKPVKVLEEQQLSGIKVLIIDSTSATIEESHRWVSLFRRQKKMQVLLFVSSGLKNEQGGADKNHYGTVRFFTKDRNTLEDLVKVVKETGGGIKSSVSHNARRLNKRLGNVPTNKAMVKFKKVEEKKSEQKSTPPVSPTASLPATAWQPGFLPPPSIASSQGTNQTAPIVKKDQEGLREARAEMKKT